MDMTRCSQAREQIWAAIRARGGPHAVGKAVKIHWTELYGWRRQGETISQERIARLRAFLTEIDDATWGIALATELDLRRERERLRALSAEPDAVDLREVLS